MVDPRDIELVRIAHDVAGRWKAAGGVVEELDDGIKLCLTPDGPCVEVEASTLRRFGRWVLSLVRVLGRKLGLEV